MCTHRGWRIRLASRSRQTTQATPKGLLRLPRATESHAAKRYDIECKKILCGLVLQSASLPTRYSIWMPLWGFSCMSGLVIYTCKIPITAPKTKKCPFQALWWHVGWSNGLGDSGLGVYEERRWIGCFQDEVKAVQDIRVVNTSLETSGFSTSGEFRLWDDRAVRKIP